ncbi:hypothetical protein HMPREF0591_4831 [Mycobacterium parascrofulaceum ATCC BAA-614]|uniref:Uncharacterized protein n=1 Tax=Mycobacterium parascrofulaceum ATCC BAA-614 TaxID=525368 RepID=D5PF87_9MYCO|nr:hypothetical protein [Mycobacterium parascrofulaceum]EFG75268.1 hypothetical protein HMPREF0591_4831 [Mycobacterium parascrofulaceum ATCC BAA-614]
MATTTQMIEATGVDVVTATDLADVDIPVLAGVQRQGDVLVRPVQGTAKTPVPTKGTPVVRGESGGNTHAIYAADGPVYCDVNAGSARDLRVALLSVPEGSTAYLAHPEHGYMGIAPGSYEIRRQREMAEENRMVAD